MSKFILPLYAPDKSFLGHVVVDAEGCAGLYVHRTHHENLPWVSPWRVSTVTGQRAYVGRLNTRADARRMAHTLSEALPARVLSGNWSGADWRKYDPERAERYYSELYGIRNYCG